MSFQGFSGLSEGRVPAEQPFPILPLRNGVLFPGTAVTLPMGRRKSLELLATLTPGAIIGVVAQRDSRVNDPGMTDLAPMGTFARLRDIQRTSNGVRATFEGLARFHVDQLTTIDPFWRGEGRLASEVAPEHAEAQALSGALLDAIKKLAPAISAESLEDYIRTLREVNDPGLLADRIAASLGLAVEKEQQVLMELDVAERLRLVIHLVAEAEAVSEVKQKIDAEVRREFGNGQREAVLREQLKAIRKELGEDGEGNDADKLRDQLDAAKLPEQARKVADRELRRLEAMNPSHMEHGVIRSYLQLLIDLPWSKQAEVKGDIDAVAKQLDADHYGLQDVKKRVLEHLAVLKMQGKARGTILCLVGPPGVGKTSLGKSIATATNRPFVRIALGGVRDEAEIRGHRRTYVGALPGRVLHALKTAGSNNAVVLLDEIDKLGQGYMGSPEAALLEVLDPEQNHTFQDHYLELPFDLSNVLFICTANSLDTLSAPLRDRLEIIELSGYTLEEKQQVARQHILPQKLAEHGIAPEMFGLSDAGLRLAITSYTREAGVRQLAQQLTKLCRALALQMARQPDSKVQALRLDETNLAEYLGKPRFVSDVAERTALPGVATGLAWTAAGGDILFIETSRMRGTGKLEITGQLGDVMKESARAALTYVRSNAATLGIDVDFLATQDLHIHVPAGGVPKDGPSAGVTMFTALTSLLTGRRVRPDTAMTGECTLRGRVLPVGGIKEKVLAAHRAGITRVILPSKNRRDIDDVPESARLQLEVIFADDMGQVLDAALEPLSAPTLGQGTHPTLLTSDMPNQNHAA